MPQPMLILYVVVVIALFALFQGVSASVNRWRKLHPRQLRRRTLADTLSPRRTLPRVLRDFEQLVRASGAGQSALPMLAFMLLAGLVAIAILAFVGRGWLVSLTGGLAAGVALPLLILLRMRQRRFTKITVQLPEVIDTLVRSLRAGHPVPLGIAIVAAEAPDPIGGEFRQVNDAMSYGLDFRAALENFADRTRLPEVKYMVAAIRIQYATGGDLAEVLSTLANVMRERVRFNMKVKALSAESRLSGRVMMLLPFVMLGGLLYLRPDLYKDVPTTPFLQWVMGAAALMLLAGMLIMRRLMNIRA